MAAYNLLVWLQPAIYSVSYRSICTSRQNVSPLQNSLQDCVTSKHLYIFPQFFNNRRVSLMLGHWIAIYPVDSAIVHLAQLVVQKLESAVHQICTLLVSLIVIPQIVIYPRGSTIPRLNNQGQLNIWGEARPTHGNSPRRASLCWKSVYAISALCSQLFLYLIFYKDEHGAYESALSQYQIALEALLPILSGETTLIDIIEKWSKVLYTDGTHYAT